MHQHSSALNRIGPKADLHPFNHPKPTPYMCYTHTKQVSWGLDVHLFVPCLFFGWCGCSWPWPLMADRLVGATGGCRGATKARSMALHEPRLGRFKGVSGILGPPSEGLGCSGKNGEVAPEQEELGRQPCYSTAELIDLRMQILVHVYSIYSCSICFSFFGEHRVMKNMAMSHAVTRLTDVNVLRCRLC